VSVKPIGTMDHPNLDKAFVKVYGTNKAMAELLDISVKQEGHKLSVTGSTDDLSIVGDILIDVEVPIVHNINLITTGMANISCQDMVMNMLNKIFLTILVCRLNLIFAT